MDNLNTIFMEQFNDWIQDSLNNSHGMDFAVNSAIYDIEGTVGNALEAHLFEDMDEIFADVVSAIANLEPEIPELIYTQDIVKCYFGFQSLCDELMAETYTDLEPFPDIPSTIEHAVHLAAHDVARMTVRLAIDELPNLANRLGLDWEDYDSLI